MLVDTDTSASASTAIASSYEELTGALAGWFRGRRVLPEESKDLAQETILRTLIHLKRHGARSEDLKPLAFTIARNLLAERARRSNGIVVTLTDEVDVPDPEPSPLDRLLEREERSEVSRAVASLASRHRQVIELSMRGDTPADIARKLGVKRNAADALLHRARRRLAVTLESSRGSLGAVLGLLPLRLRLLARRAAGAFSSMDPAAQIASAAAGLTAVGVAVALTVMPSSAPHRSPSSRPASTTVRPSAPAAPVSPKVSAPQVSHSAPPSGDAPEQPQASVDAKVGHEPEVSVRTGPQAPDDGGKRPGASVWYDQGDEREPGNDLLNPAVDITCATAPICSN